MKKKKKGAKRSALHKVNWKTPQLLLKALCFVFFLCVFTAFLSLDFFETKLNIVQGEPSPELIRAPYDRDVEDSSKYEEKLAALERELPPIYKANDDFSQELQFSFQDLMDELEFLAGSPIGSEEARQLLQQEDYYKNLSEANLRLLLSMTTSELAHSKETMHKIVFGMIQDGETGAATYEEVPDLRHRVIEQIDKSAISPAMKALLAEFLADALNRPTLVVDQQATQEALNVAAAGIRPDIYHYRTNEKIVGAGEIVDEQIYRVLVAYGLIKTESSYMPMLGIALLVLLLMILFITFVCQFSTAIVEHWQKILLVGILEVSLLTLGKGLWSVDLGNAELNNQIFFLLPVAWVTMTVTILLGIRVAVVVSIIQAIFMAVMSDPVDFISGNSPIFLVSLISGLVGAQSAACLGKRVDLLKAGIYIGLANFITLSSLTLMGHSAFADWTAGCLCVVLNVILTVILTIGALPLFEYGFKITSSVRLIELSNPNNPLLKSLLMEAPGTYNHSVMVGNLAETAAEEIQADSVLARVGALYHDIGKLKRPYFFVENQFSKENPHNKIAPTLSALILTSHTKDGLEMAKEHKLPEAIQQIIVQHHGDTLAAFFYHKALEEKLDVSEAAFRYSGPNPRTKEAALIMLADSVEAAVRSHQGGSQGKIEGIVRKIIKEKLEGGHLDQCDLTLRDLDKIAVAFVKVLSGLYHSRIVYPELPAKQKALKEPSAQSQKSQEEKK